MAKLPNVHPIVTSKYIAITPESNTGKTWVYTVWTEDLFTELGIIKWYSSWRQYCFFPNVDTLYNGDCLDDIKDFLSALKAIRKDHA